MLFIALSLQRYYYIDMYLDVTLSIELSLQTWIYFSSRLRGIPDTGTDSSIHPGQSSEQC